MSGPRAITTDGAPRPVGPYSQAIVHAGLVYTAGQIPLDPQTGKLVEGDVGAQTERVLLNLTAVLAAAGSGPERVLRTTIYLTDIADFPTVNEIYARHFRSEPAPARSTVQVAALPLGARVEIDAIAVAD